MGKATQVAGEIYEAFGRGDVPAILGHLADEFEWDVFEDDRGAVAPWLAGVRDTEGVTAFFATIGGWEIRDFRVTALGGDDHVAVAEISIHAVTPNGEIRDEEAHVWHVDEGGRVVRFRHYVDTRKHAAAA